VIAEAVIAAALMGRPQGPAPERAPSDLPADRLAYLAAAIAGEAGDDIDTAAALIVNGERESSWRTPVERCSIPGLGGWGAFGVARLWTRRYPGGTCGSIDRQVHASRGIWGWHYRDTGWSVPRSFGRYVGARAGGSHPEARARARIFWTVRAQLACACSL
jgi:hypothetical protein